MASMLVGQGIVDPAGEQHLTSVLVDFFEARMVRLPVMTPALLKLTSADFHYMPIWCPPANIRESMQISERDQLPSAVLKSWLEPVECMRG